MKTKNFVVQDVSPISRPTKRAFDWWDSPRFQAVFYAKVSSVKTGLSRPAHYTLYIRGHKVNMKQNSNDDFIQSLLVNSSRQNPPDSLKLFAQFVGSWDWSGFDYLDDGTRIPTKGKWIFEWVLNGNAIQDVFIFEDTDNKTDQLSFVEYGTTIRFPINDGKTWKAVWVGPMNRVVRIFDAKVSGTEIVLEGKNEKGDIIHWVFSKITESNFHWRGEYSSNGGESWMLYEELDAKRKD